MSFRPIISNIPDDVVAIIHFYKTDTEWPTTQEMGEWLDENKIEFYFTCGSASLFTGKRSTAFSFKSAEKATIFRLFFGGMVY